MGKILSDMAADASGIVNDPVALVILVLGLIILGVGIAKRVGKILLVGAGIISVLIVYLLLQ